MPRSIEADDAFTKSGSSPPKCVTGNEIDVPTVDDLFPLDDVEDDELTYFSEITVAHLPPASAGARHRERRGVSWQER